MGRVSVAEAARRLGVGVPRVHQRIADGSLAAERVGSQWIVDELSVLRAAEHKTPGRPLSSRSAWAIIALAEGDDAALAGLASVERSRAASRLRDLLGSVKRPAAPEEDVRHIASVLRDVLRNRAGRRLSKAAEADLPELRQDSRWESLIDPAVSGIAMMDVDGYLHGDDVEAVSRDFLLVPADQDANVVIHVLPDGQGTYPDSRLLLAADLADRRGPRDELRAAELLGEVAADCTAVER